ncbi:hypothetical protein [Streptomyces sp. NPDC002054]|uniref:hypothetical protein n=1 Tax=Streptomyces sp. NPDC002054 TaxID=3154663 RepID=UPI0033293C6C
MNQHKAWKQVASANTAKVVSLPGCSTTNLPPYCFKSRLTGGQTFTQWTVSKPRKAGTTTDAPVLPPVTAGASLPATFNGVDQNALQACLEQDPEGCLETVPGLSECVETARVCNAAALAEGETPATAAAASLGAGEPQPSAAEVQAAAAATFGVTPESVSITPPTDHALDTDAAVTWTVTSQASTTGLGAQKRSFRGFTAHYSAQTGALLDACWGDMCDS